MALYITNVNGFGLFPDPVPGSIDVPVDATVAFRAATDNGFVLAGPTEVRINGTLVWSEAGGFEPGYTGSANYVDLGPPSSSTNYLFFSLGHPDFPSLTPMTVEVTVTDITDGTLVESYSFTTVEVEGEEVEPGDSGEGSGWGAGPWGDTAWGDGEDAGSGLNVGSALAIFENVIRVEFNQAVFFNGLLDQYDASNIEKWSITPNPGTVGLDGLPARTVNVAEVRLAEDVAPEDIGRFLDVYFDRPLSPWSASYTIAVAGIFVADKSEEITGTFFAFGAYRVVEPPRVDQPIPARDFANPQTLEAARQALPVPSKILLGTYSTDDTGDYALDSGLVSLKKRIIRRLITVPGGFAHLGDDYGVGVLLYAKKLGTVSVQSQLATRAEEQISREPEVAKCRVAFRQDVRNPELWFLRVLVRTKQGLNQRFDMPLSPALLNAA